MVEPRVSYQGTGLSGDIQSHAAVEWMSRRFWRDRFVAIREPILGIVLITVLVDKTAFSAVDRVRAVQGGVARVRAARILANLNSLVS
jgi:hypothetical protein